MGRVLIRGTIVNRTKYCPNRNFIGFCTYSRSYTLWPPVVLPNKNDFLFAKKTVEKERERERGIAFRKCSVRLSSNALLPLRRSTIRVHLKLSEAPHLSRPIPHPKTDYSKNQIASRWKIPWPSYTKTSFFETRLAFWRFRVKKPRLPDFF